MRDCSDNGNAAGGHFNPMSLPLRAPGAATHHAGDFGNVTADAQGEIDTSSTRTRLMKSAAGTNSVVGHAVILRRESRRSGHPAERQRRAAHRVRHLESDDASMAGMTQS